MNTTPQIPTIKNDRDFAIPNQSFQQTAGQAPPSMTTAQMPSINTNQGFAPQYQPLPQGFQDSLRKLLPALLAVLLALPCLLERMIRVFRSSANLPRRMSKSLPLLI